MTGDRVGSSSWSYRRFEPPDIGAGRWKEGLNSGPFQEQHILLASATSPALPVAISFCSCHPAVAVVARHSLSTSWGQEASFVAA